MRTLLIILSLAITAAVWAQWQEYAEPLWITGSTNERGLAVQDSIITQRALRSDQWAIVAGRSLGTMAWMDSLYCPPTCVADDEECCNHWPVDSLIVTLTDSLFSDRGDTLAFGVGHIGFGSAVAVDSLALRMALGCEFARTGGTGSNYQGMVFVYERAHRDSSWSLTDSLTSPDIGEYHTNFGTSVSMTQDGNTIAVAGWIPQTGGSFNPYADRQGAVYVFDWITSAWVQRDYVLQSPDLDAEVQDRFGFYLSLSGDGSILVTGDKGTHSGAPAGKVWTFDWDDSLWVDRTVNITAPAATNGWFGVSTALSADGSILAVGSAIDRVYLYDWNDSLWTARPYIVSPPPGYDTSYVFQFSLYNGLALSGDGAFLAVGDYYYSDPANDPAGIWSTGAVTFFSLSAATYRTYVNIVRPVSNSDGLNYLGYGIALSDDGTRLLAGDPYWNSDTHENGAVWDYNIKIPRDAWIINGWFLGEGVEVVTVDTDTIYANEYYGLADILYLDDRDDVALLRQIRGSGERDAHGYEIVDDWSLPKEMMLTDQHGELILNVDGKPYYNLRGTLGLNQGAIRQLAGEIDRIDAILIGLGAALAALMTVVGLLKHQVNVLEARIATLEGVDPNPPNVDTEVA